MNKKIIQQQGKPSADEDAANKIFFENENVMSDDIATQAALTLQKTQKKIGAVRRKENEYHQRINSLCQSGVNNPKRQCCKTLRSTMMRNGSNDSAMGIMHDDFNKDDNIWDFKKSLVNIERQIKLQQV